MQPRRGVILVVVLVVIVLLTLSVYTFSRFMLAQRRATETTVRQTQVRLLTESGIDYLRAMLFYYDQYMLLELGGLYDNPDYFCGHIVTDGSIAITGLATGTQNAFGTYEPRHVGRFSVVAPTLSDDGMLLGEFVRFGLEDESAKVNLRWILQTDIQQPGNGRAILMRLPGVNEEIADAILDWIDDSSYEPREYGAKDEYYTMLDPPYYCRNGMIDSLDELLNVRGVTAKLLYGNDWNRNGTIDYGEPGEYEMEEYEATDGSLNLGLIAYLTLDSRETMLRPYSTPEETYYKINVNMEDTAELQTLLDELPDIDDRWDPSWSSYIISYRQQANQTAQNPSDASLGGIVSSLLGTGGTALASNSDGTVKSLMDLIGGQGSPFPDDIDEMLVYLPVLYDNLMTSDTPVVGRININQAPRMVLELLGAQEDELSETVALFTESMDAVQGTSLSQLDVWEMIDRIIAERISNPVEMLDVPEMNYPFWPYVNGIVPDLATMQMLEPYFCTQGAVFKATVVGRFDDTRSPVSRMEVWLDSSEGGALPKIIRIRDISELGPGYNAEVLGADEFAR